MALAGHSSNCKCCGQRRTLLYSSGGPAPTSVAAGEAVAEGAVPGRAADARCVGAARAVLTSAASSRSALALACKAAASGETAAGNLTAGWSAAAALPCSRCSGAAADNVAGWPAAAAVTCNRSGAICRAPASSEAAAGAVQAACESAAPSCSCSSASTRCAAVGRSAMSGDRHVSMSATAASQHSWSAPLVVTPLQRAADISQDGGNVTWRLTYMYMRGLRVDVSRQSGRKPRVRLSAALHRRRVAHSGKRSHNTTRSTAHPGNRSWAQCTATHLVWASCNVPLHHRICIFQGFSLGF